MKTYDLVCQITNHPKRITCDYYDALKVRQYFARHGIKVSIVRFGLLNHIIWKHS